MADIELVIKIPKEVYKQFKKDQKEKYVSAMISTDIITNGTPLPEGAEILTKEAYSDLCTRAADVPDTNVGDLISRQAVMDCFKKWQPYMATRLFEFEMELSALPSVTPQPEKRTEERTESHACDLISRQAVLDIAKSSKSNWIDNSVLFKRVNELPSVDPERCGDCISRQDAIDVVQKWFDRIKLNGDICLDGLRSLPSVEPERKTGHWECDQRAGEYVCSECGCNPIYERTTPDVSEIDKYRYCRWCGAPMEVDG